MSLTPDPLSINQIKSIIQNFPIGTHIDYYPEYQDQMSMKSIVLGYEINGHHIYSQNQLDFSTTGSATPKLTITAENSHHDLLQADHFCLILPGNTGEENKLDYPSKASLGRRGQFRNGNNITLIARHTDQGIVTLESSVRESSQPQSGYYRGHILVLLEIFNAELLFRDQRTHHRIKTQLPIKIQLSKDGATHAGLLSDFSELHAQIELSEEAEIFSQLAENNNVILTIKLEQNRRNFIISANIMRKQQHSIVVTMEKIFTNGHFEAFKLIDALDLKASLLQHPNTS